MSERIRDISADLAEMVTKRRKEVLLKELCGFQASEMAQTMWGIGEEEFSRIVAGTPLPKHKVSQEHIENAYRALRGLPIPSLTRSETTITEEEGRELIKSVYRAREFVLEKGEHYDPDPDGTVDSELCAVIPEDEQGVSYSGAATPDEGDTFLRIHVYDLTPEIGLIDCRFEKGVSEEDALDYNLELEYDDRQLNCPATILRPVREMASNEYRIIRYSIDNFLDRASIIPPRLA